MLTARVLMRRRCPRYPRDAKRQELLNQLARTTATAGSAHAGPAASSNGAVAAGAAAGSSAGQTPSTITLNRQPALEHEVLPVHEVGDLAKCAAGQLDLSK